MFKNVITELEVKLISDRLKYRSARPYGYKMELKGRISAFEYAIALLKNAESKPALKRGEPYDSSGRTSDVFS
jgi:hypothetical protein